MPHHKVPHDKKRRHTSLPDHVEESNVIGAHAGDATSGVPRNPDDWAEEQPIEDTATVALDAGDPSPLQPAAGSPDADSEKESMAHRARRLGEKPGTVPEDNENPRAA